MNNYSVLKDLEDFYHYEIEELKKQFCYDYYEYSTIVDCDDNLGIVKVHNCETNEIDTISFEDTELWKALYEKTEKLKDDIDSVFMEMDSLNMPKNGFINYLSKTISSIRKNHLELFTKFPICEKPFVTIETYLLDKYEEKLSTKENKKETSIQNLSFANFHIHKIQKLYRLLTKNPAFIEADEKEFVNAFSGKEINTGIKWLVKNSRNNKDISKPSLFYLIEQLIKNGYISNNNNSSFLKDISLSLFRDESGNSFSSGSLATSVTNYSKSQKKKTPSKPTRKADIDKIISELQNKP